MGNNALWNKVSGKFIVVVVIALITAGAAPINAATETGTIVVLDFVLPDPGTMLLPGTFSGVKNQIKTLDTSDEEISGSLSVFQNHGTPRRADGSLDLRQIRATMPVLSRVSVNMHRRGASSKTFPKKSYALEFAEKPGSFFGSGKDWVLHACYTDSTCLRNVMAYWQASKLFPWAPRTEFVEVFINGYYRGLYVAIEKIKLGPDRVDLPEPTDAQITGGYILESVPWNDKDADWTSTVATGGADAGAPTVWSIVQPKKSLTAAQRRYIQDFMERSFEPAFKATDRAYDARHYREYMHEQSAIDFILMQELSRNVDAYGRSMHVTKYPRLFGTLFGNNQKYPGAVTVEPPPAFDGLVHIGPVWDFDLGFGNEFDFCDPMSKDWRINESATTVYQPLWETWKQPDFRTAMSNRWRVLRDRKVIDPNLFDIQIDAFAKRISDARNRDNRIWRNLEKLQNLKDVLLSDPKSEAPWPLWECRDYNVAITFEEQKSKLKQFVRGRIAWIDAKIADPKFRQ